LEIFFFVVGKEIQVTAPKELFYVLVTSVKSDACTDVSEVPSASIFRTSG
jgi:hypothetical protein